MKWMEHGGCEWTDDEQNIKLLFSSEEIFASGQDGPYTIRNVLLLDDTETTNLIQAEDPYYQTDAYSFHDFSFQSWFIFQ